MSDEKLFLLFDLVSGLLYDINIMNNMYSDERRNLYWLK